jgi:hypothetical protein
MRRLFQVGKIRVQNYGRPSRPYAKIISVVSRLSSPASSRANAFRKNFGFFDKLRVPALQHGLSRLVEFCSPEKADLLSYLPEFLFEVLARTVAGQRHDFAHPNAGPFQSRPIDCRAKHRLTAGPIRRLLHGLDQSSTRLRRGSFALSICPGPGGFALGARLLLAVPP